MEEQDWNPMTEAANNVDNSYDRGPGAGKYQNQMERASGKARSGTVNPLKLYVTQIPQKMSSEAFRNIFQHFGQVEKTYIHEGRDNYQWGTILYTNKKSAIDAIAGLNGHNDHGFRIKYYFDTEKDLKYKRLQQQRNESNCETMSNASYDSFARDHPGSSYVSNQTPPPPYRSPPFTASSANNINFSENVSRQASTPLAVTQELEPLPKCVNCGKITLEQCTKCFTYYCSKKCMVLGYEHHTKACITIAPHTSDKDNTQKPNENCSTPIHTTGVAMRNAPAMVEFRNNANEYRKYHNLNNLNQLNSVPSVSNSYDNEDRFSVNSHASDSSAQKKQINNVGDLTDGYRNNKSEGSFTSYKEKENRAPNRSDEVSGAKGVSKWTPNNEGKDQKEMLKSDISPRTENRDSKYDSSKNTSHDETSRYKDSKSYNDRRGNRNDANYGVTSRHNDDESNDRGGYKNDANYGGTSRYNDSKSHNERGGNKTDTNYSGTSRFNDSKSNDDRGGYKSDSNYGGRSRHNDGKSHNDRGGNNKLDSGNRYNKPSENQNQSHQDASKIDNRTNGSRFNRSRDDQGPNRNDGNQRYTRSNDDRNKFRNSDKCETLEAADTKKTVGNFDDDNIKFDSTPPPKLSDVSMSRSPRSIGNNFGTGKQNTSKAQPAYVTDRLSIKEGDVVKVRINEVTTDVPDYCSVRIVEEENLLPKLSADIMGETSLPPINIVKNEKCLVCKDDERYRGVIVSESPLKVKFIDRGFCAEQCDEDQVKGCPDFYQKVKPFANKVKFVNAQDIDLDGYQRQNKMFDLRVLRKLKEMVWEAEIQVPFTERLQEARQQRASREYAEDDHRAPSKITQPVNDPPASSKNAQTMSPKKSAEPIHQQNHDEPQLVEKFVLEPDKTEQMMVTFVDTNRVFYVARPSDLEKVTGELGGETFPKLEDIEKDNLCLAPQDGVLYRARIIETDPLQVYFIDFGNTDQASKDDLKVMPRNFSSIEPLAIRVRLHTGKMQDYGINLYENHAFTFLKNDIKEKLWIVISEECLDIVVLQSVSEKECYVMKEIDTSKVNEISKLPKNPLKSDPRVGSVYLIDFDNMNWRVELIKASPPTVKYIDYGNEEEIEFSRLFELPSEWQRRRPMAFKIVIVPEGTQAPAEGSKIRIKAAGGNRWEILSK